jgi:hypothetical protein
MVDRVCIPFEPSDEVKVKAKKYLEEALEDFAFNTMCHEVERSIYIDQNDVKTLLPADFIGLSGQIEFDGKVLQLFQNSEGYPRRNSDDSYRTGTPTHFFLEGDNLILYPSPSKGGLIAIKYFARATNLEDSSTKYKRLNYKSLISNYFRVGERVQGRTSLVEATIVSDINNNDIGTLVLSDIVFPENVTDFTHDEQIVQIDDEQAMELAQTNWSGLLSNWDTLGLGGRATVTGVLYNYAKAGDKPIISAKYHPFLMDYAKASLFEDIGDYSRSERHWRRYKNNIKVSKAQASNQEYAGAIQVADVLL